MRPTTSRRVKGPWRVAAERLFLYRDATFWLNELAPARALRSRARLIRVVEETADTRTFVLRPNRFWQSHRAGQYLPIEVEIDGVRTRRCYSISSAPAARDGVSITVKRVPGGRVSNWMHDNLSAGDVIGIGEAAGEFVLPDRLPGKILFLTGGSGITPVFALLEDIACADQLDDVVLVHSAPHFDDVIFRERLRTLAERHPGFRLILNLTREPAAGGRLDSKRLAALVPDFRQRESWLCGPEGFMDRMLALWEAEGIRHQIHEERFVATVSLVDPGDVRSVNVTLTRSGRSFATTGSATLLDQAERAGANPASGCRMGICQTCKCTKRSGAVENLRTGRVSTEENEEIQLCISVPRSDVEIDL